MQKVINVLAILSFLGLSSILATSGYVYWRRDAIAEQVTENITQAATEAIADVLPGMLDAAMPELPNVTGGAVPMGEGKGGSVPGMRLP
jgi:hypothetical protein|tara:strand:- start:187 stop:453 length:267 start_codon:yes stop_codon:yes gene_type:complete